MTPRYGKLWPTNGWDCWPVWVTPANFNWFRLLALLLHQRRSTEVNKTLQDVWPSPGLVHYIHFERLLPPNGILLNSFCVQVLRSPILAALLHSTRAAAMSQSLWHGTRNGSTEFSERVPDIFGWMAITLGIGPQSSYYYVLIQFFTFIFNCSLHQWQKNTHQEKLIVRISAVNALPPHVLTYQLLLPPPPPPHYNNYFLMLLNWPHLEVAPYQDRSPKKNTCWYLKHILQARMPFLSPIQRKN